MQNTQTEILVKQQEILKKIASTGNCIIVGRGADSILRQYNTINLFVYSDMKSKINRCKIKAEQKENLTDKELEKKIMQIDKNRKNYYSLISSKEWGNKNNYQLCINTAGIEIKTIIPALAQYIESYFKFKKE